MFHAFTRPRYQVSVYRTIGPLVKFIYTEDTVSAVGVRNYTVFFNDPKV